MRRRTLLHAGTAAGIAGAVLGPSAWVQAAPATDAAADEAAVIVGRFGPQPAPERVRRVYAAGPPAAVLVAALAPEKLLGWPLSLSEAARAYLGAPLRGLAHVGRLAGRGSTVALETLLQWQPDVILDAGTADASYLSAMRRASEQTGLPTLLVQGRIGAHGAQLREVGRRMGVPERGAALGAQADSWVALAQALSERVAPGQRPRVYYGRGPDGLETGLAGSINLELIEFCAGRNVAAEAGSGSLTRVSLEQVLAWDPEVIVTQDSAFAQRALHDPLWRSVRAVRQRRVHCAPVLPFGWLDGPPGVNRLIGLRWLLERLHPGHPLLRQLAPWPQVVQQFYRQFYGLQLTPAQLQALLDVG